jgi:hypothetical protein
MITWLGRVKNVECCGVAKLPYTKNERKLKTQESKPKTQTQAKENQKLFLNCEFLKSRPPLQVPVYFLL